MLEDPPSITLLCMYHMQNSQNASNSQKIFASYLYPTSCPNLQGCTLCDQADANINVF